MSLSAKALRVLDDVKMGLSILYGAEYFTEEDWIKIDYLIHKGKYVFTHGPPISNILEEPLMTFDEPKEDEKLEKHEVQAHAFASTRTEAAMASEEQTPSSPSTADFVDPHVETPNETSAESSSDDASDPPPSSSAPAMFNFSEATTPISSVPAKSTVRDGLKVGYTKEQLEEVKAFNAGLTKAGQKKRPKYEPVEDYPSTNWSEEATDITKPSEFYPSPAPTERAAHINSWVSDVDAAETKALSIAAPTPKLSNPSAKVLLEDFIKAHGKNPKSINDVYQPNNPQHNPKRPESRASVKTVKTSISAAKSIFQETPGTSTRPLPKLQVAYGTILRAKRSCPSKSQIELEVREGDKIKVLKWVSGITHTGENGRTKQRGQFPDWIFKLPPPPSAPAQALLAETSAAKKLAADKAEMEKTRTWDGAEVGKAAEWDEVPTRRTNQPRSAVVAKPSNGGLKASRFSILEDEAEVKPVQEITSAMEKEFGMIINQKVDEILKLRGVSATPAPQPRNPIGKLNKSFNEPLKIVPIKTEVCWFWRTPGKDCRFTAEECRDLHTLIPPTGAAPQNLRMGKPTWGAAADYSPSVTSASVFTPTGPEDRRFNSKTCYYWAVEGKCNYSSEECKYLHEHTSAGIAIRPGWTKTPRHWGMDTWKNLGEGANGEDGERDDGEFVLDEVVEGSTWGDTSAWGEPAAEASGSTWDDDKYKPPHVVALENKVRQQTVGW